METNVEKIVNWWAKTISNPCPFDNGDTTGVRNFISMLGMSIAQDARKNSITEERIEKFKQTLKKRIIEKHGENPEYLRIFVDYGPKDVLRDALTNAEISEDVCPIKTWTEISNGKAFVALGLGSKPQEL